MIIFNEEGNLERCLRSARSFADEIVAVDMMSTDNSRAVLEQLGARVYDYEWRGDYADARNYCISKAACDYIFLLDADEKADIVRPLAFKKYLDESPHDLIPVRIVNFYGRTPPDIRRSHFSGGLRLARNNDIHFTGKLHEKIDTGGKSVDMSGIAERYIRILHYGYMHNAYKKKEGRNLAIIGGDSGNDDGWTHYYLAAEYYKQGLAEDAYREVNLSIIFFLGKGVKPPPLAYKLKYDILITQHNYADAYNGIIKAITLYPDYVDLHFYKGILQYTNCEYEIAARTFAHCLVLGEHNLNHLILSGAGSFLALHYIGLCCQKTGRTDEAIQAFTQTDVLFPELEKEPELKHYLPPF